jgi:3-carboxy-cis,cis-muconate cycloisomerase
MGGKIFGPVFVPEEFREAVSGRSWLRAMLETEAALAFSEAPRALDFCREEVRS